MRSSWALVVVLAGCPGREPANPSTTPAGAASCEAMADHIVKMMNPGGAADETVNALRHGISERCVGDKWSQDAQRCFLALKANEEIRCVPLLTVGQREAFDGAIDAAIGKPPAGGTGP